MTKGIVQTDTVLDRILLQTVSDLARRRAELGVENLAREIDANTRVPLSLSGAIDRKVVAVIAEFKRGSPSRGVFPVEVEPAHVARAYCAGGAAAISCLTDAPFFHGSEKDLRAVAAVAHDDARKTPILRKDFTIDPYQLLEARAWGADAVLLIVSALDDGLLESLFREARDLGLSVLVEVHSEAEMARALQLEPLMIGVNNRNLRSFEVDLSVTECLAEMVPDGTLLVSESGIYTREHVERVRDAGAAAVLVGESLIMQDDREAAVRHLAGVAR
jgi:indole-3-glycerol phosphate synthase